jgi:hypothetical protein
MALNVIMCYYVYLKKRDNMNSLLAARRLVKPMLGVATMCVFGAAGGAYVYSRKKAESREIVDTEANVLDTTIQDINEKFEEIVHGDNVYLYFRHEMSSKAPVRDIPLTHPILRVIWSRDIQEKDIPVHEHCGYLVYYNHGHDGAGKKYPDYPHVTNVDNTLVKGPKPKKARGTYSIIYSHERVATKKQ